MATVPWSLYVGTDTFSFRCCVKSAYCGVVLTVLSILAAAALSAQSVPSSGGQRASRAELSSRAEQLDQDTVVGKLNARERTAALGELVAIRNRLQAGDFQVGDHVVITIVHDSVRSDTASVRDGLRVSVLNLPDMSLAGILRSELDERMGSHVARFLRNATVRTNVLTRVGIFGAVQAPGYYFISPDRPVSDIVMLARGPAADANLNGMTIRRGQALLVTAKQSKRLIEEGKTLEQLDVQSGDELVVPLKRKINWQIVIQVFFIISSLLFTLIAFLQWYYDRRNA